MPAVTKGEAVERLTRAVKEELPPDELQEVYHELFPDQAHRSPDGKEGGTPLVQRLVDYLNGGLAVEELVDLWKLILPRDRRVWYNEEEDRIHYNEQVQTIPTK
jgi:hypothetical protein